MFGTRNVVMVFVIYSYFLYINASNSNKKKNGDYETRLENIQECKSPNPPFAKKNTIIPKYTIKIVNGKRYVSGCTIVKAPTPFVNFSARTFTIDSTGKRVTKFQITKVNCRNIIAKVILRFANVVFSTRNCLLPIGRYSYDNMDVDKILHATPGWHAPGDLFHEVQLVANNSTLFCDVAHVKITEN